ncbi:MAG: PqqD family peptide modification chaperone [Thermoanaerobaculaceae bacterium]
MIDQVQPGSRLLVNPEVVLREEDADGALLFNPDTNRIRVLNSTGVFVWHLCDGTRDLPAVARAVKAGFEGAPDDEVEQHVREFVEEMVNTGFIGVLVEPDAGAR